jgi:hypothetical protein
MATTKSTTSGKMFTPPIRPAEAGDGPTAESDALRLLKADHDEVATMFEGHDDSDDDGEKEELAQRICAALTVHAQSRRRYSIRRPEKSWRRTSWSAREQRRSVQKFGRRYSRPAMRLNGAGGA